MVAAFLAGVDVPSSLPPVWQKWLGPKYGRQLPLLSSAWLGGLQSVDRHRQLSLLPSAVRIDCTLTCCRPSAAMWRWRSC